MDWLNGGNVALVLFFIALAGLIFRKNMMITVLSIGIMNVAIVLSFVTMNSSMAHEAPMSATAIETAADPVPQALMITTVVIGVSITAVFLQLTLNFYRRYKTLDWQAAKLLAMGQHEAEVTPGPVEPIDVFGIAKRWWRELR